MQGKFIELTPLVTSPATSSAVKRNINILFAEALKGCPHSFSSSSSNFLSWLVGEQWLSQEGRTPLVRGARGSTHVPLP